MSLASASLVLLLLHPPPTATSPEATTAGVAPSVAPAPEKGPFGDFEGAFVLLDLKSGTVERVGGERCDKRLSPCSTFKIQGSLIGLETGVLNGEGDGTTFKWDGVERQIKSWNADQTLASAIRNSAVWYFQRVAREVGRDRLAAWVEATQYGNRDTSGPVDGFWLEDSLRISPNEQVEFLARLYRGELPCRPEVATTVQRLLVQTERGGVTVSGKTGSGRGGATPELGWFVGHVAGPDRAHVFAVGLEGAGASGRIAKEMALTFLAERGLLR